MEKSNIGAIKCAWEFFKGNYSLHFGAIAILIVCTLLGAIPLLGLFFAFAYSILELSIQFYFGRALLTSKNLEGIRELAAKTTIKDLFLTYLSHAAGAFLALFLISLIFLSIFLFLSGFNTQMQEIAVAENGMSMMAQSMSVMSLSHSLFSLFFMAIVLFLFYFFPAVMGKAILSESFNDAFKTVFLLFNPSFWKKCFHKEYFILIAIWSIILFFALLILFALSSTIILLPIALVGAYLISLYNAAIYIFAYQLIES